MAKKILVRRGTTAQHSTFIGDLAEVTMDITKNTLVIHDGITPGGHHMSNDTQTQGHINNTSNPHSVTKEQVGLGNVPNVDTTNPSNITQSANYRFVTDTEKSTWNGKQDVITGAATTITSSNLTESRALVSDSNGKVGVSTVTSTELSYINGVTSNIQNQLNAKAPLNSPALTGTPTAPTPTAGDSSTKIATTAFVDGAISAGGGGLKNSQIFTSSNTWTCPAGVTKVIVGICGGGGGGGGCRRYGSSGGGGGSVMKWGAFTVTPGTSYIITVGAGGAGGAANGGNGGGGGTSSFGTLFSSRGGGGTSQSSHIAGKSTYYNYYGGAGSLSGGGEPVGSSYHVSEPGESAVRVNFGLSTVSVTRVGVGGAGGIGGTKLDAATGTRRTSSGAGVAATHPGHGGGGAYSTTNTVYAGGAGFRGQVEIYW